MPPGGGPGALLPEYSVEVVELYGVEYPWEFDVFVPSEVAESGVRKVRVSFSSFVRSSWR